MGNSPMLHHFIRSNRNLNCPLPILRAKKALAGMTAGQVLHIIATDPGAVKDFEAFTEPGSVAIILSVCPSDIPPNAFLARRIGSGQFKPVASSS